MSDVAPILFVSPRRNEEGKDPNRLLTEPFYATPAQVAQNRGPSWCTAWGNGITVTDCVVNNFQRSLA